MKRVLWIVLLLCGAIAAGVLAGEGFCRSASARKIVALVVDAPPAKAFVRQENLRAASHDETVANDDIEREIDLLRDQFGDDRVFEQARKFSGFTRESLRARVTEDWRARRWIEKQIAPELRIDPAEVRRFYDSNSSRFAQPQRFRASHIFLAAPDGYPDEVITEKQSAIQGLSVRILAGENFSALVTEASEDEATRSRGGDLGYFSTARMPPEFIAELGKLQVGEISAPIRSHLGFHIVQLTDVKAPREMSFEESQSEIGGILANEKRAAAVARVSSQLNAQ